MGEGREPGERGWCEQSTAAAGDGRLGEQTLGKRPEEGEGEEGRQDEHI